MKRKVAEFNTQVGRVTNYLWEAGKNLSQMYRNHQNLPRNDCTKVSGKAGYHLCTEPPSSDERNVQARRTAEAAPPRRARAVCSESSIVLPDMDERHVEVRCQVGKGGVGSRAGMPISHREHALGDHWVFS